MVQSGVGNEPDPLMELLNPTTSVPRYTYAVSIEFILN